jgi:hypothetical protein
MGVPLLSYTHTNEMQVGLLILLTGDNANS